MKRLFWIFAAVMLFAGCNDDDDNSVQKMDPSELPMQTKSFVETAYPSARIVDIEVEHGIIEMEIIDNGVERELYFTLDGEWLRTTTDILRADLPQAVLTAVAGTEYASWTIDDIDWVQTPSGEWYLLELDKPKSNREVNLKITATGEILP